MGTTLRDRLVEARDDPQDLGFGEISEVGRDALDEIDRLRGALEAVTNFYQVTHCHAAARAGLAGMAVGEKPKV